MMMMLITTDQLMSDNKSEVALDFSLSNRNSPMDREHPQSPPGGETARSQLDAILDSSHTPRHHLESHLALPGTLPGGMSLAEYSAQLMRAFPSSFLTKSMRYTEPVSKLDYLSSPYYSIPSDTCGMEAINASARSALMAVDDAKDVVYWERRRKNNEAAKRSRDARRAKEDEITTRASMLEQENVRLKVEVATLKTETNKLRWLLYNG